MVTVFKVESATCSPDHSSFASPSSLYHNTLFYCLYCASHYGKSPTYLWVYMLILPLPFPSPNENICSMRARILPVLFIPITSTSSYNRAGYTVGVHLDMYCIKIYKAAPSLQCHLFPPVGSSILLAGNRAGPMTPREEANSTLASFLAQGLHFQDLPQRVNHW